MAEKRKDGKGTVLKDGESQRKNGTYMYRYKDGDKKQHTVYAKTLRELREKEAEIQKAILDGISYAAGEETVYGLAKKYLSLHTNISISTQNTYDSLLRKLENQEFSKCKIRNVKNSDAKAFFLSLSQEGYKCNSIKSLHAILQPAFKMAVNDGALYRNPFSFSVSEVIPDDKENRCALSAKQVSDYLEFVKNSKWRGCYNQLVILLGTGMRVSEMCGLTIDSVDMANRCIHVTKQLLYNDGVGRYIAPPKTESGIRDLPMSASVYRAFADVLENRKAPDVEPMVDGCTGFLFFGRDGKPQQRNTFERIMHSILKAYNNTHAVQLPNITPHVLRHTALTNLASNGMKPKSLQNFAGHSDVQTTLNIYVHSSYEQTRQDFLRAINE